MKANWILYPDDRKIFASDYALSLPNGQYHLVTVRGHEYWVHPYEGKLNGIRHAAVLLSYPGNAFGSPKALRIFICSDSALADEEPLAHYGRPWKIEVMFKLYKMYPDLKAFMVRTAKAIDRQLTMFRWLNYSSLLELRPLVLYLRVSAPCSLSVSEGRQQTLPSAVATTAPQLPIF